MVAPPHRARRSYGKLVAFLSARTRDVAGAEDALADAFEAALRDWPVQGVPSSPDAWLLAVARRKLIDDSRRRRTGEQGAATLQLIADASTEPGDPGGLPDDRLALMFACTHPAIEPLVRAPLMLQTLLGFDAATIASAFLVSPAAMGQRLVRAKTKIHQAGISLIVPEHSELSGRLDAVLAATYAAFAEGWSDPAGTDAHRRDLAEEGVWLARLLAAQLPDEAEALGLLALVLYAQGRRHARRDAAGEYVPPDLQDTARWDRPLLDEAEGLLRHASTLGRVGRYQLEAAVQSAHVARRHGRHADWPAIVGLYDALLAMTASPVVAVNRAVALAEIQGAAAGPAALDAVSGEPRLHAYQPYWAARAPLLERSGDAETAGAAYLRAIGSAPDAAVRRYLQGCLDALRPRRQVQSPAAPGSRPRAQVSEQLGLQPAAQGLCACAQRVAFVKRLQHGGVEGGHAAVTQADEVQVIAHIVDPAVPVGQPTRQVHAGHELVGGKVLVVVPALLDGERRGVGIGAGGAVFLASRGGATDGHQAARAQHAQHVRERLTPERVVLEALGRDHGVEARRGQLEQVAGAGQVDARAGLQVDAGVLAGLELVAHRAIDVERADLEHARALEVTAVVGAYG